MKNDIEKVLTTETLIAHCQKIQNEYGIQPIYFDTSCRIWPWHLVQVSEVDYIKSKHFVLLTGNTHS